MRYGSVRVKSTEGCYLDMLYIVSVLVLFVIQVGIFEKARGIARFTPEISFNRIIRVPHPGDNIIEVLQIYAYNHNLNIDPAYIIINLQTRLHCSLACLTLQLKHTLDCRATLERQVVRILVLHVLCDPERSRTASC